MIEILQKSRLLFVAAITMVAFAGNSVLCRMALERTTVDAMSFSVIRILSAALVLSVLSVMRGSWKTSGSWGSALALAGYVFAFSFAYRDLSASTGAVLLFGAVQLTMVFAGYRAGERLGGKARWGVAGLVCGVAVILFPGVTTPAPGSALLMLASGGCWGLYSLMGRKRGDPLIATAGNFQFCTIIALAFSLLSFALAGAPVNLDRPGIIFAVCSGALASGLGYVLWYSLVPELGAIRSAVLQLTVPVLASVGGVLFLAEKPSIRLIMAIVGVMTGVLLVLWEKHERS